MSVISRRSKSKAVTTAAKGAARAAPVAAGTTIVAKAAPVVVRTAAVAAPVAAAVAARGHDVGARTSGQVEAVRGQARDLGAKAGPALTAAAASAATSAGAAKDWAAPRLAGAGEMGRAQLGTAYGRGIEVAAPGVARAADALAPKVDATRDHIVEALLPRLVEAVTAATAAAAAAAGAATDSAAGASRSALSSTSTSARAVTGAGTAGKKKSAGKASVLQKKAELETSRRRGGLGRLLLVTAIVGAAGAAGYAAFKRSSTPADPWVPATGGAEPAGNPSTGTASGSTTPTGASGGGLLSQPGSGEGLGAGTAASSSKDVDGTVPDGVDATPDDSGRRPTGAGQSPTKGGRAPKGEQTPSGSTKEVAGTSTPTAGTGGAGGTGSSPESVVPPRTTPAAPAGSTSKEESRRADPETARLRDIQASGESSEVTETVVRPAPTRAKPPADQAGKPTASPREDQSGGVPASNPGGGALKPGDAKPAGATSHADESTGSSDAAKKKGTANDG